MNPACNQNRKLSAKVTSVNAYKGHPQLLSYTTSKGAELGFTRALASNLVKKGIRVNGVAPGPIWTPFIPADSEPEEVKAFGHNVPMERAGSPVKWRPATFFWPARMRLILPAKYSIPTAAPL